MKSEADFKRELVKQAKGLGAYARRFEDRFAVGRLDVLIKFRDMPPVWVEGKLITEGYAFAPTARQYREGLEIEAAGMVALLVGWHWSMGTMHVSPWVRKADRRHCFCVYDQDLYADQLRSYVERWASDQALVALRVTTPLPMPAED